MSRLKIVSGLPYKIVIESWNTHASSSSQEALLWKAVAWGSREKRERSHSVPLTLPASCSLFLIKRLPSQAFVGHRQIMTCHAILLFAARPGLLLRGLILSAAFSYYFSLVYLYMYTYIYLLTSYDASGAIFVRCVFISISRFSESRVCFQK